jgi:pyruvyl transferase EpsO
LRRQVEVGLDSAIPGHGAVGMIEFPGSDTNVGNHLMWLVVTRYLRSRGRRLAYVAHRKNYRTEAMLQAIGKGPILISGGAAISGLWPEVRALRQRVIAEFASNPIVILPQTVAFLDEADREGSRAALDAHPNLTLLVRDPVSLKLATATYRRVRVLMVPDLAFLLPPPRRRRPAMHQSIWLSRDDVEAAATAVPAGAYRFDWAGRRMREWPLPWFLLRVSGLVSRARNQVSAPLAQRASNAVLALLYELIAAQVVAEGNRVADLGEVFVSDRLHGHLMAVVRGQPTVAMPDAYGKNEAIFRAWSEAFPHTAWAATGAEAQLAVQALLS